jgi:hypothetical protein
MTHGTVHTFESEELEISPLGVMPPGNFHMEHVPYSLSSELGGFEIKSLSSISGLDKKAISTRS